MFSRPSFVATLARRLSKPMLPLLGLPRSSSISRCPCLPPCPFTLASHSSPLILPSYPAHLLLNPSDFWPAPSLLICPTSFIFPSSLFQFRRRALLCFLPILHVWRLALPARADFLLLGFSDSGPRPSFIFACSSPYLARCTPLHHVTRTLPFALTRAFGTFIVFISRYLPSPIFFLHLRASCTRRSLVRIFIPCALHAPVHVPLLPSLLGNACRAFSHPRASSCPPAGF
ncbi:hypothetical protein FB451DRAFT_105561 [Mycena latifolia]|nr:hypothetical protein FB451DRAFT_105561 [Mycena latifolia]